MPGGMWCMHAAPLALAAPIIRWGPQASSNVLRTRMRCSKCGAKNASLQHPGHVNAIVGTTPFPVVRGRTTARRSVLSPMMPIADLWVSADPKAWDDALEHYWRLLKPENVALEQSLDALDVERLRRMNARAWYDFLRDEYFVWKYTAANRLDSTRRLLLRYIDDDTLGDLDQIRRRLLNLDLDDIRAGFDAASAIHGLGTAGASGLLALMYPQNFGTVDQFVVKALVQVSGLPEAAALARMDPESLTTDDGVLLIKVLRRKAAENNRVLKSDAWTPRKLDKVLWAVRPAPQKKGAGS